MHPSGYAVLRYRRSPQRALHAAAPHDPELPTGELAVIKGGQVDARHSQRKTYTWLVVDAILPCQADQKHCKESCC